MRIIRMHVDSDFLCQAKYLETLFFKKKYIWQIFMVLALILYKVY